MIRHMVLFRWNEGVDPAHVAATQAALAELPGRIPQIAHYSFGADLGLAPTTLDFGITALFASLDDFVTYRDHPDHQAFIQTFVTPFVAERLAVQFETP
jgi:hypothetical protein